MGAVCCREEPIDYDGEVELAHFVLLRSVGRGAFGKVRVVQHRNTKSMYALKYINKLKCIKMRAVENIISERRLLEAIDFPFIVNLRYAFQDDENLFMVLDLMLGGDLRFHLERYGKLKEEWVQFYVAEIALSLDYLHSKNIVHRDLKPDNVLLDENGHAHITDFNIAVRYSEKKLPSAVAGSMAYMAPEVLKKKGYTSSVDWWSLGVLAYELVFGKRPFKGKTNDTLSYSIQNDPLEFPDDAHTLVSEECIDCIKALMNRDPTQRLGCGQDGMYRLTAHPWFQDVSWNELARKAVQAPFIPDAKKPNFDATHELEELLLEDNPLKIKRRRAATTHTSIRTSNHRSTHTTFHQQASEGSKYMQYMEDHFLVYDFSKPAENERIKKEYALRKTAEKQHTSPGESANYPEIRPMSATSNCPQPPPEIAVSDSDSMPMDVLMPARPSFLDYPSDEWKHRSMATSNGLSSVISVRESALISEWPMPPKTIPVAQPTQALTADRLRQLHDELPGPTHPLNRPSGTSKHPDPYGASLYTDLFRGTHAHQDDYDMDIYDAYEPPSPGYSERSLINRSISRGQREEVATFKQPTRPQGGSLTERRRPAPATIAHGINQVKSQKPSVLDGKMFAPRDNVEHHHENAHTATSGWNDGLAQLDDDDDDGVRGLPYEYSGESMDNHTQRNHTRSNPHSSTSSITSSINSPKSSHSSSITLSIKTATPSQIPARKVPQTSIPPIPSHAHPGGVPR